MEIPVGAPTDRISSAPGQILKVVSVDRFQALQCALATLLSADLAKRKEVDQRPPLDLGDPFGKLDQAIRCDQ